MTVPERDKERYDRGFRKKGELDALATTLKHSLLLQVRPLKSRKELVHLFGRQPPQDLVLNGSARKPVDDTQEQPFPSLAGSTQQQAGFFFPNDPQVSYASRFTSRSRADRGD
jgi:hypothetical protein